MVIVKVTEVKPFTLVLRMSLIVNNDYQDCVQTSNFLLESSCCPCGASTRALQKFFRFIAPISFIYWTNCSNIFFLLDHCFNIFLLDHCFNIYCFGRIVPLMTLQKLLQPPSLISTPSNTFYEYCDSKRLQRFVLKYSKPKVCLKPKNKSLKILMKNPCVIHQMRRDSVS